ncbi:pre-rRNA-processing protein TSR2 homolog isoform X2 [Lacerta agilis]|uniref:pre-rRNA-processing protein TSR2 homolog isoform X2 n=1 Tax=Lacerta agilis TaxID=80427 RepID=UPI00141A6438|nr:pre-rRNA-processing protein TSR2 homolog isoform X2 [Lacerta agilis]
MALEEHTAKRKLNGWWRLWSNTFKATTFNSLSTFFSVADLELEEIEDFLAELMNNEFDTMIEDGSLAQVSQQLRLFFGQCQQGEGAAVHEAIVRLAQKKQEAKVAAAKSKPAEESSSEEEQGTEEEAMDCSAAPSMNGPQPSPPPSSNADPEDGWTLVRKKKK